MVKFFSSLNIRTQLLVLFLVFSALPVAAIMPVVIKGLDQIRESQMFQAKSTAEAINNVIERNLFERYGDVQAFGLNAAAHDENNWRRFSQDNPLVQAINGYMVKYGLYKLMLYVDTKGDVLALNTKDARDRSLPYDKITGKNFANESWFKNAMEGKYLPGKNGFNGTVVENPARSAHVSELYGDDGFSMVFAAPVYNGHGKLVGVWANFADFGLVEDIIFGFYKSLAANGFKSSEIALIDKNGVVLVEYAPSKGAGYKRDLSVVGQYNLAQKLDAAELTVKGGEGYKISVNEDKHIDEVTGYAHTKGAYNYPGLGWSTIVRIPADEAFASANNMWLRIKIALALTTVIIILCGLGFGYLTARPFRALARNITRLSKGDIHITLPSNNSRNEVGLLTQAAQSMVNVIQNMKHNLDELISAASRGNLNKQIDTKVMEGAFLEITNSMNGLMKTFSEPAQKSIEMLNAVARGDLSKEMVGQYQGIFSDIQRSINLSINTIRDIKEQVINLINDAKEGVLDTRIDITKFDGEFASLAKDMNQLMDTIIGPINQSIEILQQFARGDLTREMAGDYKGSFEKMQSALNSSILQLNKMVEKIKDAADQVTNAAQEIASSSADLSMRAEQQAASLEETASSIEEMTSTVKQNAGNAANANKLSEQAAIIAERGGAVVEDSVVAMSSIEKSSQRISDIIGLIDEIAFQTNLLALNAAVEAARAGEAGKGFAVVATEVRALANRSSVASREIKTLINESSEQVQSGSDLVKNAGETLKEIVGSVKEVACIISEIAEASSEQSAGINEINSAVSHMDETTQQNAALAEEGTAAAQSLVEQANTLTRLVEFFILSKEEKKEDESEETIVPFKVKKSSREIEKPQTRKKVAVIASQSQKPNTKSENNKISKMEQGHGWEEF